MRLEAPLEMHDAPVAGLEITDVSGNELVVHVTEPELRIVWKITGKVVRELGQEDLRDLPKAVLDIRSLRRFSAEGAREHVVRETRARAVAENARVNPELLKIRERGTGVAASRTRQGDHRARTPR